MILRPRAVAIAACVCLDCGATFETTQRTSPVPSGGGAAASDGGTADAGSGSVPTSLDAGPGLPADPTFLGPFCERETVIIGFDATEAEPNPSSEMVRAYALAAVNHIRSRTGLPPYRADAALDDIAERALAAVSTLGIHGYFIQNCMNKAHNYGRSCEAGWAQENYGAAFGTRRSWKEGIRIPLCGMMTEPKGEGHRANIESPKFTRMGASAAGTQKNGAAWTHEFGW